MRLQYVEWNGIELVRDLPQLLPDIRQLAIALLSSLSSLLLFYSLALTI